MAYTFFGQCLGTTKAGTPCRHVTVYANGYCRQHGGDSTEFERQRLEHIRQKAMRRHKRWRRKLQKLGITISGSKAINGGQTTN
jgi:hypothetical protein